MHAGKGGGWHGLPLAGRDGAGLESSFEHRTAQAVAVCGDRAFLAVLEFGPRASFPRWPGKGAPWGFTLLCAHGCHVSWRAVARIQGDRLPRPGGTVPTSSQLKKKLRRKLIALSPALTGADSRVGGTLCRWAWAGRGGRGAGDALRGRMQPAEALQRVRDSAERKPRHRAKRGLRFHGGIRALSRKVIGGFLCVRREHVFMLPGPLAKSLGGARRRAGRAWRPWRGFANGPVVGTRPREHPASRRPPQTTPGHGDHSAPHPHDKPHGGSRRAPAVGRPACRDPRLARGTRARPPGSRLGRELGPQVFL